jgi:C_GCAxxG_C_C family probable redox protein
MSREEMDTLAYQAHVDGFNCAESVLLSAVRVLGLGPQGLTPRIASCFGGGVGRTHSEICGALSGALMALGLAHGRDNPTEPRERIYALAVELRQRFLDAHGSTQCRDLLAAFGPQDNWAACKRLSADTAALLHDFLKEVAARP